MINVFKVYVRWMYVEVYFMVGNVIKVKEVKFFVILLLIMRCKFLMLWLRLNRLFVFLFDFEFKIDYLSSI